MRLNRDERGGSLRALAGELDEQLAAGVRRVVLDNTYLTRAARSHVVETAERHSLAVRCVWLDTPLAQAQVNLVERLLERFGSLPTPEQIRARAARRGRADAADLPDAGAARARAAVGRRGLRRGREVPFVRVRIGDGRPGVFVGAAARSGPASTGARDADPAAPHLLFDWTPRRRRGARGEAARLAGAVSGPVEVAVCPHRRARPAAGAGRRCPACRWPSRALTPSTRRARS